MRLKPVPTLSEQKTFMETRALTAALAFQHHLQAIEALEADLNCWVSLDKRGARDAAERSTIRHSQGKSLSVLDGIGIGIKDLLDVRGMPTGNGLPLEGLPMATHDAEAVRRLREAGAIIMGKLNMHELALGATNDNPHFRACHNPWRPGFSPGGSSGGSAAAVAAGFCAGALGSDNMGSIRIPAAMCGISGLKPSQGLIPTEGMAVLSPSTGVVGPLAHDVKGLAYLLGVLTGSETFANMAGGGLGSSPLGGARLGMIEGVALAACTPDVVSGFEAAIAVLRDLGAECVPVDLGNWERYRYHCLLLIEHEGARTQAELLNDPESLLSDAVRKMLAYGARLSDEKMRQVTVIRGELQETLDHLFSKVDGILTPTTPFPAFPFAETPAPSLAQYMAPANLCGLPALSIPMGFDGAGLPLGLQIMAPKGKDATTLELGMAFQEVTAWHQQRPPMLR